MKPAARVIEKCGGFAAVAEMVEVHVSRVHRWTYPKDRGGTEGLIPLHHQQPLLNAARARGIDLLPVDFQDSRQPPLLLRVPRLRRRKAA